MKSICGGNFHLNCLHNAKETTGQTVYEQLQEISDFKMLEDIINEGLSKKQLTVKIYKLRWIRRTRVNLIPGLLGAILLGMFMIK